MSEHTYDFRVKSVTDVVDGDTFDLLVDQGFYDYTVVRIRLKDVDTYEIFGRNAHELGQGAKRFVEDWVAGRDLRCQTFTSSDSATPLPDGGFGRWLGDLYDIETGEHLNVALRDAGFTEEDGL